MSQQPDYPTIIRRLQEQITTLSEQVAARARGGAAGLEVAKPQVFDETPSKVSGFVIACKLYRKTKMRGGASGGTDSVGAVACARRSSRCVEGKCVGGTKGRRIRIQDSRGVSSRNKEGVWRKRGGVGKGSRVKKAGAGRKNDGRICVRVQESSEEKWI